MAYSLTKPRRAVSAVAVGAAALVLIAPGAAHAATIRGTGGDDRLTGTPRADRIHGLGGSDRLFGGGGPDTEYGGAGDDVLHGGPGADTLYPQGDRDHVYGDGGPDWIWASTGGRDVVRCGTGYDQVWVDRSDRYRGCEFVEVFPPG
jgi:Ca2+-binding RTX toxin-like protein